MFNQPTLNMAAGIQFMNQNGGDSAGAGSAGGAGGAGGAMAIDFGDAGSYADYLLGGESRGAGANNGGNSGGDSNGSGGQNNDGQGFDPAAFWTDPEPSAGVPANQAQGSASSEGGSGQANPAVQAVQNILSGAKFDDVFTPDAISALADSDPSKFNANIQSFGQQVLRQSAIIAIQIAQAVQQEMQQTFEQRLNSSFTGRDNYEAMVKNIPGADDPAIQPMIRPIFERALKNTKGNREQAVEMTRAMIQFQIEQLGGAYGGVRTAPESGVSNRTNWMDGLFGRD